MCLLTYKVAWKKEVINIETTRYLCEIQRGFRPKIGQADAPKAETEGSSRYLGDLTCNDSAITRVRVGSRPSPRPTRLRGIQTHGQKDMQNFQNWVYQLQGGITEKNIYQAYLHHFCNKDMETSKCFLIRWIHLLPTIKSRSSAPTFLLGSADLHHCSSLS